MGKRIEEFWKNFGGFIIGAFFGILMIWLKVIDLIIAVLIVLIFGSIGAYVQRNKKKVKNVLINLLEKW